MEPIINNRSPETRQGRWMAGDYVPGLVSVIVPTYNRAHLLGEAMDSVLAQSYRPIELVVVDDGSTDETQGLLAQWAGRCAGDDGFTLRCPRQENRGASAARNLGLRECRGEYIQFLDSDDLLLEGKLASQVRALKQDALADIAYGPRHTKLARRGYIKPLLDLQARPFPETVAVANLFTPEALYRREILRRTGPWDERLQCSQEWEYNVRVMAHVRKAVAVPGVHVLVRGDFADRISYLKKGNPRYFPSRLLAIQLVHETVRRHGTLTSQLERALAKPWLRMAVEAMSVGLNREARAILRRPPFDSRNRRLWRLQRNALYAAAMCPPFCTRLAHRACKRVLDWMRGMGRRP